MRVFAGLQATAIRAWQSLQSLGESFVGAVAAPFAGIADAASVAWSRVTGTADAAWNGLGASARRIGVWIRAPFDALGNVATSAFDRARRHAATLWQTVEGGRSVIGGLQAVGGAVGRVLQSAASSLLGVFRDLPLVSTLTEVFSSVRGFLAGDTTFFEAGRSILTTLGEGIASAATVPADLLKKSLGKLRSLLPFSDAETGPLSNLTASGASVLRTLAQGMTGMLALPGTVVGQALEGMLGTVRGGWRQLRSMGASAREAFAAPFQGIAQSATLPGQAVAGALTRMNEGMSRIAAPAMLSGTLALTPMVTADIPQAGTPLLEAERAVVATRPAPPPATSRLLAETRGSPTPGGGASAESVSVDVRSILDALLGKLDALADRPIDVSVTTLLDGREVAQSVYQDIRERKIRNYETM